MSMLVGCQKGFAIFFEQPSPDAEHRTKVSGRPYIMVIEDGDPANQLEEGARAFSRQMIQA